MTSQQVGTFLLGLAVIIVLSRFMGAAARRLGQPAVIGEIAAGILLGPTLFNGAVSHALFPEEVQPSLSAVATCGLALFMFMVGLEMDRASVGKRVRAALSVSVGSMVVPFVLGAGLGWFLVRNHPSDPPWVFALFLGTAMSVSALPVLARVLMDRNMHRTPLGALALASAASGDIMAWSVLAAVVGAAGAGGPQQWLIVLVLPYAAVMVGVVRPLLQRLVAKRAATGRCTVGIFSVVLAGLLLSSAATEYLGLHFIFGAFLFGAVMPRVGAEQLQVEIVQRIGPVCQVVFLPVFFVLAGLQVDLSQTGLSGLGEFALILVVAITGKFAGAFVGARVQGTGARQSAALAVLMNTRGLTELIVLSVGLQLGILSSDLYALMVMMALVTTAVTGPLLHVIYPRQYVERDLLEAATGPGSSPPSSAESAARGPTDPAACG
ncbi:cation:proton antiporter [Streptomyces sp. SID8352]|uniref:cation:proton antiporter n=1 Tax=Streptomyces sp. SID8352 TaxID=2690338 RepID=UPI001371ECAD|nr:cation:proton antiporter [Streptomyces sp. SID8352]MYU21141.1 cation/H(+) antiporter [Streptomyces sp. SID8352]